MLEETKAGDLSLIYAVRAGKIGVARELVQSGVDVNAVDEAGQSALHHAAATACRPAIRILVGTGKCNYLIQDENGDYASDLAITWGRDGAVARLLSKHQWRQAHAQGVPPYILK